MFAVGSEVHHLQVKITEMSREMDTIREDKTKYQLKAAELVGTCLLPGLYLFFACISLYFPV